MRERALGIQAERGAGSHLVGLPDVMVQAGSHLATYFSSEAGRVRIAVPFLREAIELAQPCFLIASGKNGWPSSTPTRRNGTAMRTRPASELKYVARCEPACTITSGSPTRWEPAPRSAWIPKARSLISIVAPRATNRPAFHPDQFRRLRFTRTGDRRAAGPALSIPGWRRATRALAGASRFRPSRSNGALRHENSVPLDQTGRNQAHRITQRGQSPSRGKTSCAKRLITPPSNALGTLTM